MICFGSPERDYSLSKGDMTLEKGLRSQHSKDVQLQSDHPNIKVYKPRLHVSVNLLFEVWPPSYATPSPSPCVRAHEQYR